MTIRVLYASPFWQERSGPEESLLTLLTTEHFASRIEPVVALPPGAAYAPRFRSAGIQTVEYRADLFRRQITPISLARWGRSVALARREAAALMARFLPDIAHSNMETTFGLALAATAARVPRVHHVRSISFSRPRVAGDLLLRAVRHYSDTQIAISSTVAALFPAGPGPSTVENPVGDSLFCLDANPVKNGRPVVLALGRIAPRKNLELFLEVAALTQADAEFRVVGPVEPDDSAYAASLERRAIQLGIADRVTFAGPEPAVNALGAAQVLVNAGANEGFCRVVAEAMAAGVVPVARAHGATRTLVEDGRTGRLFTTASEGADAVDELLAAPQLRQSLARAARAEAHARFSAEGAAETVVALYSRLLAEG